MKELRCLGQKKNRICNQLLYKYKILEDEMVVSIKCPNCNTYTILKLPFKKIENEKNNEKNKMIIKGLINN